MHGSSSTAAGSARQRPSCKSIVRHCKNTGGRQSSIPSRSNAMSARDMPPHTRNAGGHSNTNTTPHILGVGLGYRQPEFDAFGIPLAERAPRFNEAIGLMRRLWTEERVTHQGRFYTVNDAGLSLKPVRPGGPPLYIAAQAEVSVRRAAGIGDAWLIVNSGGLGKIAPLMQTYRAALQEYGRTPIEYPITVECYVGTRHATAHEECRGPLEYKYNAYAAWGLEDRTSDSFEEFAG